MNKRRAVLGASLLVLLTVGGGVFYSFFHTTSKTNQADLTQEELAQTVAEKCKSTQPQALMLAEKTFSSPPTLTVVEKADVAKATSLVNGFLSIALRSPPSSNEDRQARNLLSPNLQDSSDALAHPGDLLALSEPAAYDLAPRKVKTSGEKHTVVLYARFKTHEGKKYVFFGLGNQETPTFAIDDIYPVFCSSKTEENYRKTLDYTARKDRTAAPKPSSANTQP